MIERALRHLRRRQPSGEVNRGEALAQEQGGASGAPLVNPQTVRGGGGAGESRAGSKVVTRAKAGEKQRDEYPEDTLAPEGVENQRRTPSTSRFGTEGSEVQILSLRPLLLENIGKVDRPCSAVVRHSRRFSASDRYADVMLKSATDPRRLSA